MMMKILNKKVPNWIFVVVLFVEFCFYLFICLNRESYAIPDVEYPLSDTFQINNIDYELVSNPVSYNGVDTLDGFSVEKYYTSSNEQIFKLEYNTSKNYQGIYNKGDSIVDYGLLYIMANSYPNVDIKGANGESLNGNFQTWITQTSIYLYSYYSELEDNGSVSTTSVNYLSEEQIYSIMHGREVIIKSNDSNNGLTYTTSGDDTIYDTYIKDLVDNALKVRETPNKTLEINTENKNISITNDNKYYQTSLITVSGSPSDNFNAFELVLNSVPEGTIVVDEDGKEITDLTNLSVTTKFYLRIPKENVSEENKKLTITAIGSFKTYEGNYYTVDGNNEFTRVSIVNNNIEKDLNIDLNHTVDSPNTMSNISKIVYLVGSIILLIGIVVVIYFYKRDKKK